MNHGLQTVIISSIIANFEAGESKAAEAVRQESKGSEVMLAMLAKATVCNFDLANHRGRTTRCSPPSAEDLQLFDSRRRAFVPKHGCLLPRALSSDLAWPGLLVGLCRGPLLVSLALPGSGEVS